MLSIHEKEFVTFTEYLKQNYGINLTKKKNLIEGRLSNYITEHGFNSFKDYLAMAFADKTGEEMTFLINKLTTNHTYFMREWKSLEFYRDMILPFFESSLKDHDLRVWSAGCSSGEEPYMISMINKDYFENSGSSWDTTVLATDIAVSVLEKAQKGIYDEEAVSVLPSMWKLKYFQRTADGRYQACSSLRDSVIFRIFNLMEPSFPFKRRFHAIFCRNVMIYFDAPTKKALIKRYYDNLVPGGYLIIGQSESINREISDFKYIMPSIYRKE